MKVVRIGAQDHKSLKKAMGFIVENRRGYQSALKPLGEARVDCFKSVGFISTGHTLKHETYHTTDLADDYYKDAFGIFSWGYHRLKGAVKRALKKYS